MEPRNQSKSPETTARTQPAKASAEQTTARALAVCVLLLLAVALVFGQTLEYGFVNYDDNKYVSDNPNLAHGLTPEAVFWAFTTDRCSNWHPLTWLSYLLDYQIYGANSRGFHLSNILLHAATVITLFLLLWRLTGDLWPSAFVAAVFAVHPLRAESVAWVAERKDVLSGLLFMLTLAAYVGYVRRPFAFLRYSLVIVLFALGLMAKPMLVTLPFVLLLLDYWPLGRNAPWWRLVAEKLPLLVLSAASCLFTLVAQAAAVKRLDFIPLGSRMANAAVCYVAYVGQLFYPAKLAVLYPLSSQALSTQEIAGALFLLAVMTAAAAVCWRRCPWLLVGWFWYLGMLVPVIGLVQVGEQSMADRYTYLPQIGLLIALAWGADRAMRSWPYRGWLYAMASAVAVAILMGCAWQQTSYWRDSETLWTHTIACTGPNAIAHNNLGTARFVRGRSDEAIAEFNRALEIDPRFEWAYNNCGLTLAGMGRLDEAIVQYQKALELKPDFAEAHNNFGLALAASGRLDEAIAQFSKAVELQPDSADARHNLAVALANKARQK